ncbi:hypothetical protein LTR17_023946 [Elasticomyces elasticus]|nr:hypothetical protein LTR17_023946 [Elasticomyces elasticus]
MAKGSSKYMPSLIDLYIAASKYFAELALGKVMLTFADALSTQPFRRPAVLQQVYTTHAEAARVFGPLMVAYCATSDYDLKILTASGCGREMLSETSEFAVDLLAMVAEVKARKRSSKTGASKNGLTA